MKANRREELIHKLVTTFHLSVPERQQLHPGCVLTEEVKTVIESELAQYGWHPRNWRPHTPGNLVWEGHAIEAVHGGSFKVHSQASVAIEPTRLRASRILEFGSEDEAIDSYLKEEFPSGKIDGIAMVSQSSNKANC